MGCIQSYFKKAATGSSQASPTDVVKHIIEQERRTESEISRVPIVSQEELSPVNDEEADNEAAERGSLHCVEATAVRTLAASTGTVAILGTTAKYNENVESRRSVHSEQGYIFHHNQDYQITQKYEPELKENDLKTNVSSIIDNEAIKTNNIITTATIEKPPLEANQINNIINLKTDINEQSESSKKPPPIIDVEPPEKVTVEKYLPKVIDVMKKESLDENEVIIPPISSNLTDTKLKSTLMLEKESSDNEIEFSDKTNENSEKESTSSEVVSIINKTKDADKEDKQKEHILQKQISIETVRLNRLSLGQQSVESDQNTLEISSADDVVKNESTDMTSPESLRESIEESLIKDIVISPNADSKGDIESWKSEKDPREISNTSLNTLGDESEDVHSDFDPELSKEHKAIIRRFDTISSNGESSYRPEEHNYPSVTEVPELEEYAANQNYILDSANEEVFDMDEGHCCLKENVRESARQEVDRICEQAIENVTIMMNDTNNFIRETKECNDDINNISEYNNVSESSLLSAIDSVIAEKGSDFDSLSLIDEQSECKSAHMILSIDETRNQPASSILKMNLEAEKRLQDCSFLREDSANSMQENFRSVITHKDISLNNDKETIDSINEDLPKPPNIEDFPPIPENLDQFDITEDELKAVQLPEGTESENMPNKHMANDNLMELAASKIQAGIRGYLTRKQIKDFKYNKQGEHDTFDELNTKNYVKSKRLSLDSKLGDVESIRKLPKLKTTLSECVEEEKTNMDHEKAATKIQTTFRNYRARKSICLGDARRKLTNGRLAEPATNNEKEKCEYQSTNDREYDLPAKNLNDLETLVEEEKKTSEPTNDEDDSLKQAAVKIQATYRGFRIRKSLQISASAATKIQAHFRGYKVRKSLKRSSSLNDLRNSASSSCSNMSSQQELEKQVTKIQAGVRGYLVRKRHSLQNVAAAKIQMNYRKYKSRKESRARGQIHN